LCDANVDTDSIATQWDGVSSKGKSGLQTKYAWLAGDGKG